MLLQAKLSFAIVSRVTRSAYRSAAPLYGTDIEVQYDPNAIRVDNVFGQQVGHIPRTVAAKLAPYLVGSESRRCVA